jgi:restriction system protein
MPAIQASLNQTLQNVALFATGTVGQTPPGILLQTLVIPKRETSEGPLIESVANVWIEIIRFLNQSPENIHQLHWRKLEELIAATYDRRGFERVILTPPSGDKGRDVIAYSSQFGTLKFIDQVKAYSPGRLVTADEVRSLVGVLSRDTSASKGIVTTSSEFAPGVHDEFKDMIPSRLELKPREALIAWLKGITS